MSDWAAVAVDAPAPAVGRWVLIRRDVADPSEVAFFACGGPPGTTLAELVRVAGTRWSIEECFEIGKGDCGLDHYEVRSWVGWHRHITPSLFALAAVAVIRSRAVAGPKKKAAGLIRLSVPEVRKLLLRVVRAHAPPTARALGWSVWRRRHQHRVRLSHYRKRRAKPPDE